MDVDKKEGIVFSHLYPTCSRRTITSNTFAIREIVEFAYKSGLIIKAVVKFSPLISKKGISLPKKTIVNNIPVYSVPTIGVREWYFKGATKYLLKLLKVPDRSDFSISHFCRNLTIPSDLYGQDISKKIFVVHSSDLRHKNLQRCLADADYVLARSPMLLESIKNKTTKPLTNSQNLLVSGVDFQAIAKEYMKDLIDDELVIIIASLFIERKKIIESLCAVNLLRNKYKIKVHLYGDGPLKQDIKNLIITSNLTDIVNFYGFCNQEQVFSSMNKSHVFLMPSTRETFGLVYLEAMAAGCVVIGHKGTGIHGFIEEGKEGFLVSSSIPEEIAQNIDKYMNSDRARMHKDASKFARKYTRKHAGETLVKVVERVCQS